MQKYPIIKEFLDYLTYEKHFSNHTIKCYSADLQQYALYLHSPTEPRPAEHHAQVSPPPYAPGPDSSAATAVAVDVTNLILQADINVIRAFLAQLNQENYSQQIKIIHSQGKDTKSKTDLSYHRNKTNSSKSNRFVMPYLQYPF